MSRTPASEVGAHNARVKAARRLRKRAIRSRERLFLAEGPQAVREALGRPDSVVEVFATADCAARNGELVEAADAQGVGWYAVSPVVLSSIAQTVTPQGVVAVCRFLDREIGGLLADRESTAVPPLVVVCADVRDPGNAGTVIRCADAAGADGVVLAGSSVDPYNGKCVRASAGSLFHVPIVAGVSVAEAVGELRRAGLTVVAADGSGDTDLHRTDDAGLFAGPTGWLFGNEAWGLPAEVTALADAVVRVPIYGRAESLNLATAAAVCLYTTTRAQRRVVEGD
ncbi:MAG: RNA methyltransferase [Propionibacteriales bacterium]|nr:RNA methyltransferase [Propionibacteriales bacterium]